jgi:hypothetical protein
MVIQGGRTAAMSANYEMCVAITGSDPIRLGDIIAACMDEWPFEAASAGDSGTECSLCGEGRLLGNRTESDFADRLAAAVWEANGGYCEVKVTATFLDSLPCTEHVRGPEHYETWGAADKKGSGK